MAESWFRHDTNARNDIKLVKLRRKGLDRIGLFWCVVEMLRETEGWKISIDDVDDILYDMRCEKVVFDDLFDCGLLEKDESFFWSNSLMKRMEEYESVIQKRRESGSKGGKKKAENNRVVTNAKQESSKIVASAKQNCSKSLANRIELNGLELNGIEQNAIQSPSGVIAPHEFYISTWSSVFGCSPIVSNSSIERECGFKLKGLNQKIVRETIEKYHDALNGEWSWIETRVDAFSFLTDTKYGFNWFLNATREMLVRKKRKVDAPVFDEKGEEVLF